MNSFDCVVQVNRTYYVENIPINMNILLNLKKENNIM